MGTILALLPIWLIYMVNQDHLPVGRGRAGPVAEGVIDAMGTQRA